MSLNTTPAAAWLSLSNKLSDALFSLVVLSPSVCKASLFLLEDSSGPEFVCTLELTGRDSDGKTGKAHISADGPKLLPMSQDLLSDAEKQAFCLFCKGAQETTLDQVEDLLIWTKSLNQKSLCISASPRIDAMGDSGPERDSSISISCIERTAEQLHSFSNGILQALLMASSLPQSEPELFEAACVLLGELESSVLNSSSLHTDRAFRRNSL